MGEAETGDYFVGKELSIEQEGGGRRVATVVAHYPSTGHHHVRYADGGGGAEDRVLLKEVKWDYHRKQAAPGASGARRAVQDSDSKALPEAARARVLAHDASATRPLRVRRRTCSRRRARARRRTCRRRGRARARDSQLALLCRCRHVRAVSVLSRHVHAPNHGLSETVRKGPWAHASRSTTAVARAAGPVHWLPVSPSQAGSLQSRW